MKGNWTHLHCVNRGTIRQMIFVYAAPPHPATRTLRLFVPLTRDTVALWSFIVINTSVPKLAFRHHQHSRVFVCDLRRMADQSSSLPSTAQGRREWSMRSSMNLLRS